MWRDGKSCKFRQNNQERLYCKEYLSKDSKKMRKEVIKRWKKEFQTEGKTHSLKQERIPGGLESSKEAGGTRDGLVKGINKRGDQ